MYVEPSSFFEQLFCLLSFTIHVLESVNQVKIKANVTSTGACPPDHFLSWKADAPHWLNVSLKYTVFCCGRNKEEFCMSPKRYKEQLKFLKCCEKRISRSEEVPRCNITTALQRLHIFNPYHTPQPEVFFYSGFEITADGKNDTWYSSKYFYLGLEQTICTKPSKFYVTVDKANVTFVWGMPPRMSCTSFRFHLRYSIVRDDCSDDSNQSETGEVETIPYSPNPLRQRTFSKVVSVESLLKSYRDYLCKLTCDVYSITESAAASVLVKRHSRVPRVVPRDLLVQKQNNFKKKRNVTLTWKAPSASCSAEWNGKPVKFLLQYFQTQNSSSHAIAPTPESDVTSVNIDPNSSSVIISNLSRFQEYAVTLAMCTDAGCGQNRSTIIKSEPDPPTRRVKIRRSEGTQPWIIVLIALLLSGAVVAVGIVSLVVI